MQHDDTTTAPGATTIAPRGSVHSLLTEAEAARDGGPSSENLARGLAAAETAWETLELLAETGPERRRAGLLLLHFRYRTGALSSTVDLGLALLPALRASGPREELIDTLRTVALCAVDAHRFDVALTAAEEAHREAQQLGEPGRLSLATNTLGCFFERTGDPWQAERLLREAIDIARPLPEWRPLFAGLNNLSAVLIGAHYMLRDAVPLDQAREPLDQARAPAEEALVRARTLADPFTRVFVQGNLGEVLVLLGEATEARHHLDEALADALRYGFEAQVPRVGCSMGELALLEERPDEAWQTLNALLDQPALAQQPSTRLRVHHALWRTARALNRPVDSLVHLEAYLHLERQRAVTQLRAQSQLFVTRVEAEHARLQARQHSERADALEADARRDPLTRLANRRELDRRWPELLQHAQVGGTPLGVAMVDVDRFKSVNDRLGHGLGDRVLVTLAQLMRAATRGADLVTRVGGEEFLLLLPDTPPERALEVCERLRERVESHDWAALAPGSTPPLAVTVSIGLSSTPPFDARRVTRRADEALYAAKAAGRNRVVVG
jgi:diguanylate cyclase (GGDEF)-like protein